ncbi:MAG: hypothetical protein DMD47_10265 [Gemmatimonadetes bacterium]|nr:MAG: hypothetical protein DMD47_10265 [Gemmatimonadota bacterium]
MPTRRCRPPRPPRPRRGPLPQLRHHHNPIGPRAPASPGSIDRRLERREPSHREDCRGTACCAPLFC